jgi:pimeloyl-ACP methyl ester carboxylesterase
MILHGLWGASENWLPVADRLADRFRVILPDLRGHGRSPRAGGMNLEAMSDDIRELITALALPEPPAILGHSLGGKVAMVLWLKQRDILSRMIVADIAPVSYPPEHHGEHARLLARAERMDLSRFPTLTALAASLPDDDDRQILLKNIRKGERGLEWKIDLAAIRADLPRLLDFPGHLPPAAPGDAVLFIRGGASGYIPGIAPILPLFPGARLVQLDGCGHRLHEECPDALARLVREYLA